MFSVANNAISDKLRGSGKGSCIFKTYPVTQDLLFVACVAFFIFVITSASAQSEQFKFKHLNINNDLSNPEVRAIIKDSRGFVWIGTGVGLNRFDGYTVKSFLNNPRDTTSIIDNSIYGLFETPEGFIGAKTLSGLTLYHPDKENFQRNLEPFYTRYGVSEKLKDIVKDVDGAFWFVEPDKLIRYSPKDHTSIVMQHSGGESSSITNDVISNFTIDERGNRWLVHSNGIAEKIEIHNGIARVARRITSVLEASNHQQTDYRILCDSDEDIWIGGPGVQGIFYYNVRHNTLQHFTTNSKELRLNENSVYNLIEAEDGRIWIGTDHGGINIVDKKDFTVKYIRHQDGDEASLAENTVNCLYKDDQRIIWIGTYKRGVSYYHANIYPFDLYKHYSLDPYSLPFEDINRFEEDSKGNLWIGTNGGGLLYFNRQTGQFTQYLNEPGNPNSISGNVIVSLCMDSDENLWIGTFNEGLNKFDGKKFIRYRSIPGDTSSLPSQNIWEIFEDSKKRLWIGTVDAGAALFDRKTGKFHHLKKLEPNGLQSVTIDAIAEDRQGNIWFGTSQGIDVLSADQKTFTHYSSSSDSKSVSSNKIVLAIKPDSKGRIWVGTYDGLNLFDPSKKEFRLFGQNPKHDAVLTIQEDNFGNLWMSTLNGLSEMTFVNNSSDSVSYKRHTESDGLQGRQFNLNAGFRTRNGELVFGGPTGFNILSGGERKEAPPLRKIIFSDVELYEKQVAIGEQIDGVVVLKKSITEATEITLPPNKHFFSIKFSAFNYFNPDRDQYMYKLEGLNSDWLPVDARNHEIVFNGLNPGHYTLKLKAANSDGVWIDKEAKLMITILPPFWKTHTAFALYVALLIGILFVARRMIQQREKLKFALEKERREIQHIHELDMMKVKFFTNVSHEFRTPLTLILTPIERLIKNSTNPDQMTQLQLIQRNGKRLMTLVNQLLDFKKLEVHDIKFVPSKGDIVAFTRDAVFSFSDLSDKKHIKLSFDTSIEHLETSFDQDKLEKILFNLLSNAIKFTLENGVVSVSLHLVHEGEGKFLRIDVRDSGIGIPEDKLDKIFDPFFQNEVPKSLVNVGSGIGLSITKEFVRIHGGRVTVSSEVGKGSCFSVFLPVSEIDAHEESLHDASMQEGEEVSDAQDAVQTEEAVEKQTGKTKKKTLLLVEDNDDFRFYLKDNLKFLYTIYEAENGVAGWNQILSVQPDLIVSDIMMPEMNGIDLCTKVKSDKRVSHIPVILLTARSSEEQRLEGFKTGADDYITKPFNFEVLEARINNLLRQREKSQKSFRKTLEVKSSELQITPLDVKFIENAVKSVEKNISAQDFSIEDLGVELGISRAYVFRKILALTGKTPLEFIRTIRLQHAAQLLEKSQLSVREVAYKVGFNNPKYFTKYFKEQFHVLPSEYVTLKKKEASSNDPV